MFALREANESRSAPFASLVHLLAHPLQPPLVHELQPQRVPAGAFVRPFQPGVAVARLVHASPFRLHSLRGLQWIGNPTQERRKDHLPTSFAEDNVAGVGPLVRGDTPPPTQARCHVDQDPLAVSPFPEIVQPTDVHAQPWYSSWPARLPNPIRLDRSGPHVAQPVAWFIGTSGRGTPPSAAMGRIALPRKMPREHHW